MSLVRNSMVLLETHGLPIYDQTIQLVVDQVFKSPDVPKTAKEMMMYPKSELSKSLVEPANNIYCKQTISKLQVKYLSQKERQLEEDLRAEIERNSYW